MVRQTTEVTPVKVTPPRLRTYGSTLICFSVQIGYSLLECSLLLTLENADVLYVIHFAQ